jgi:hypothetical protein
MSERSHDPAYNAHVCLDQTTRRSGEESDVQAMRFKSRNLAVIREHHDSKPGGP